MMTERYGCSCISCIVAHRLRDKLRIITTFAKCKFTDMYGQIHRNLMTQQGEDQNDYSFCMYKL